MASALTWMLATVALLVSVTAESDLPTCPEVKEQLAAQCGGRMGCFEPKCDGDDFAAVQCMGSGCFCVTAQGSAIGDYSWGYGDYSTSDCECARAQVAGENIACNSDGSYMTASDDDDVPMVSNETMTSEGQ